MILAAAQIREELSVRKFKAIDPQDEEYFLPSREWVAKFHQYHLRRPWPYKPGKSDCEDAAIAARNDARIAAAGGELPPGVGFAFGIIKVAVSNFNTIRLQGGTHVANIIRTPQEWLYYDRQGIVKPWEDCIAHGDLVRFDSVVI